MQVAAGSDGIQKLLAAEQEAQRIVNEARKAKGDRLRQAKVEAEKEIAAYRAEREGAYQKKISEGSTGSVATFQRLQSETALAVQKIQADVKAKKSDVMDMLMNYVTGVRF
ncbi:V-type proton ATPase subunit G [Tetrabaena socialis]|uniref:V-type proton ATPase subunit G n=1 Tax=Tetrabaena socialis TaxID=47790 RepID=A0A2J7ZZQ0_9CHLO|nr:V-type proton ATPase subunit G [Tetrabaena socialis]|eukprot:PNH05757.1 V-type proton ATPase subunit G [Tetrabaena socialis]